MARPVRVTAKQPILCDGQPRDIGEAFETPAEVADSLVSQGYAAYVLTEPEPPAPTTSVTDEPPAPTTKRRTKPEG